MFGHQSSGNRNRGNSINWKLFQVLFILQSCLILQSACHQTRNNNDHGLLRSPNHGIFFIPPNNTSIDASKPVVGVGVAVTVTETSEKSNPTSESMSISTPTHDSQMDDDDENLLDELDKLAATPPEPEDAVDEDEVEEDTNKAKRSRGYLKRLLQRLGIASKTEPTREREFEAQMADDSSMDADSPPVQTTPKAGNSLLSKLNPINKISYKINTARNVVNRALNVVGLGSKPKPAEGGAGEGTGGGEGQDDEGSTRDAGGGGGGDDAAESGSGSVFGCQFLEMLLVSFGVLFVGKWKLL